VFQGFLVKTLATFFAASATGLGAPMTTLISGESQVLINWVAPSQPINGVDIEQSSDSGNTWVTVTKLPPTTTHIRVQGLTDGKNYYFRVRWIWPDNSIGIPSTTMLGVPINNPNVPSGLVATASDTQVALNWDQTAQKSVIGYEIEQSSDGGTSWKVVTANTGSPSAGYLASGLTIGTTYTYRIKALAFGGGQSNFSDSAVVKISAPPTGGFALNYSINLTKITLSWAVPTDIPDVQNYDVNVSGDGGINWFSVAKTSGGINKAIVPYVIGGSTYQVIATSSTGVTSSSEVQLVQTNIIPDPVTFPTFNSGNGTSNGSDNGTLGGSSSNQHGNANATPSATPATPSTGKTNSSPPIILIAILLVVLGSGAWFFIGLRNRDSKKGPRKRRKSKKRPKKKLAKESEGLAAKRAVTNPSSKSEEDIRGKKSK